jgi:NADH:ubiquinone oxidoreductase subunit 3 (subunit A)
MHAPKTYGFVEMVTFVVLLVVAYVYVWKGGWS